MCLWLINSYFEDGLTIEHMAIGNSPIRPQPSILNSCLHRCGQSVYEKNITLRWPQPPVGQELVVWVSQSSPV